jgi:hypothetical protein
MLRYPRLPLAVAEQMARSHAGQNVAVLAAASGRGHPAAIYAPVGGSRVDHRRLDEIQSLARDIARRHGYPGLGGAAERAGFDSDLTPVLLAAMDLAPNEAQDTRMWAFIGCVLVPDLARWRYPGDAEAGTPAERFLGGPRGIRNILGRLWWRAYTLQIAPSSSPSQSVPALGEDEMVQITERPMLAANRRLAAQIADSLFEAADRYPAIPRSEIMREAIKRLRRLTAIVAFDMVGDEELIGEVDAQFELAARTLERLRPS